MKATIIASTRLSADFISVCAALGYEPVVGARPTAASILAEFAGRLCYRSWGRPNPKTATNEGYIANIMDHKHFSVLEHGSVTFYITGVSRNLTHELVRHRHFSYSQVSQRYCPEDDSEVITPEAVKGLIKDDAWVGSDIIDHVGVAKSIYRHLVEALKAKGYEKKKAQQAARFILPGNTETAIVVSGNHRSWREFVDKRYSEFADPEIRALAGLVLTQLKELEPNIYQDFEEKEF